MLNYIGKEYFMRRTNTLALTQRDVLRIEQLMIVCVICRLLASKQTTN